MNEVNLSGRLTKNPDIRSFQKNDGTAGLKATYTLAVDRRRRRQAAGNTQDGQDQTDYFRCVAFGKTAEFAQKFLCKGAKVIIHGQLRSGSFIGRNGDKIFITEVVVNNHEFGESKEENDKRRAAAFAGSYAQQGYMGQGYQGQPQYGNYNGQYGQGYQQAPQYGQAGYQYGQGYTGQQMSTPPAQPANTGTLPTQQNASQQIPNQYPQQGAASPAPYQQVPPAVQQASPAAFQQAAPVYGAQTAPQNGVSYTPSGFMNIPDGIDEELPFN